MPLTSYEKDLLSDFLNELKDRFSTDGCNDYSIPDTPENQSIAEAASRISEGEDYDGLYRQEGKIYIHNQTLLQYLHQRLLDS